MASVEALDYLLNGEDAWSEYNKKAEGIIDLSFADLSKEDLRNRVFTNCDLSGAQMLQTNLDGASFINSNLRGIQLIHASLIGCIFDEVLAIRTNFYKTVIRDSQFSKVRFSNANFMGATLKNCRLEACHVMRSIITDTRFEKVVFINTILEELQGDDCYFTECLFTNYTNTTKIRLKRSNFNSCSFKNATLVNSKFERGEIINCEFLECGLNSLILDGTKVEKLDLSFSTIKYIDIQALNPSKATLLNTAFVECIWPEQTGRITLTGKYIPSPFLISQPVQDVFGVSPALRREISDAQYIMSKINQAGNVKQKILFRIWGLTSAFGQSLTRLTISSILVVFIHTLGFNFIKCSAASSHILDMATLLSDFIYLGQVFMGFEASNITTINPIQALIVISARIVGLLALGLWITIASSQLNRLGSG
jgi:uncharacterized protein YjbI with pentapeptide repeats